MERIASEMLDTCLRIGSRDNMTVIIIVFKNGKTRGGVDVSNTNSGDNTAPPVPPTSV